MNSKIRVVEGSLRFDDNAPHRGVRECVSGVEKAVEDLQALERNHRGRVFRHGKEHQMSHEDVALKASLEATIKRLDLTIIQDLPV